MPLRKAALKGNWKEFKNILNDQEKRLDTSLATLLRMPITKGRATILHVAAGARQKTFVKEIIKSIEPWDQEMVLETLLIQDPKGQTSFCFAAAAGDVEIAKIMVNRIPNLNKAILRDQANRRMTQTPLYQAVMFGRKEMASYLYEETENFWKQHGWEQKEINVLFFMSISTDLYGKYT